MFDYWITEVDEQIYTESLTVLAICEWNRVDCFARNSLERSIVRGQHN